MSCNSNSNLVPSPPTNLASCAIPIGGSNSSILDTCCNGHINAMATYSAPGSNSNARSDNGCFQFCVTDTPELVQGCLINTLGEYAKGAPVFECFNVGNVKKDSGSSGYGNTGARVHARGMSWTACLVVGLGFFGAAMGTI
ncbi:hypothetical protein GQ44DRAFT_832288 [Phaeosphaeriaceae sp. PMI808]|nr:hypothetical protein GQ44DRAFT_832288 [Phaeosphaeriaceae sp. PMI808]